MLVHNLRSSLTSGRIILSGDSNKDDIVKLAQITSKIGLYSSADFRDDVSYLVGKLTV